MTIIHPDAEKRYPASFRRIREAIASSSRLPDDYEVSKIELWVDSAPAQRYTSHGQEVLVELPEEGMIVPVVVELFFDDILVQARTMGQTIFDHVPQFFQFAEV
jgi:hypothetical protein